MMELKDKIAILRKKGNITQADLANKLLVTRQAVSKWETGEALPSIENIVQLSHIFKISIDQLVDKNKDIDKLRKNKKINTITIMATSLLLIVVVVLYYIIKNRDLIISGKTFLLNRMDIFFVFLFILILILATGLLITSNK